MNTVKCDMVTLFLKNNIQNSRTQNMQWKRRYIDVSMKLKSFNDSPKRSAFSTGKRPNDAEFAFVYDVVGNMAIAKSVDARGDSSHRKRRVLRRW